MTNEIAIRGIDDAARISKALAESGFYKDVQTAAQAMVKVMAGIELGITPLAAMSGIHIVEGKTTLGSGLVASQIQRSGKFRTRIIEMTEDRCELEFQEMENGQWVKLNPNSVFTFEDAKRAELTGKKNWQRYRKAMLYARALTQGARMHTPQVFGGPIYTPEELGDNDLSKTLDVSAEVVESNTTSETKAKVETPAAPTTPTPTAEQPKPKKELPKPETMEKLQNLFESLTFTNKERNEMRNAAAMWDKETAQTKLSELTLISAERMSKGATDGQIEFAGDKLEEAKDLFTADEIKKAMDGLKAAADYKTANEKVVKILAAVGSRRKKAEEKAIAEKASKKETSKAEMLQAVMNAATDAEVIDGPKDDEDEAA